MGGLEAFNQIRLSPKLTSLNAEKSLIASSFTNNLTSQMVISLEVEATEEAVVAQEHLAEEEEASLILLPKCSKAPEAAAPPQTSLQCAP